MISSKVGFEAKAILEIKSQSITIKIQLAIMKPQF